MNKTDNTLGRAYTSPVCKWTELSIERSYLNTGSDFGNGLKGWNNGGGINDESGDWE